MKYYCDNKRHLVCVPYSIENLHKMADDLKIKRHWFHKNHYDIPVMRKSEIINICGGTVSPKTIVKIIRGKWPLKWDPDSLKNIEYRYEGLVTINPRMVGFK